MQTTYFFSNVPNNLLKGEKMTKRKVFNITDINNENVIELQQVAKGFGAKIEQAGISNLALELFFRDKQDDYSNIIDKMRNEHLI